MAQGKLFKPNKMQRRTVKEMASFGVPQRSIARVIGIDVNTLEKHFRDELDTAMAIANAKVAKNLFQWATSKDPRCQTSAIFWLKTRMGWKETVKVETDPANEEAQAIIGALSTEQLRAIAAILGSARAKPDPRPGANGSGGAEPNRIH